MCSSVQPDSKSESETPTVLVLDDEPFVRHAARRFLKGSGYGCVEAETVDAAIELLRKTPVVAAMLDMRLPDGRTGLDVLTDLRSIPEFREIPVLIKADETTQLKKLAFVMDACRKTGLNKFSLQSR